jgi:hypothetical protein
MQELVSQFCRMGIARVMYVKVIEHIGEAQHCCQCLDPGKAPLVESCFVVPTD